jgi:thiaminase/transcriptional activator TenA
VHKRAAGAGRRFESSPFVKEAGALWKQATTAAFLDALAAGNLPGRAFNRWLEQDYHFARGLLSFQAIVLARALRTAQATLIGGLASLDSELSWFEAHAQRRGVSLEAPLHPACRRYTDFLIRAAYTEHPRALVAMLFGVEVSYLAAWSALEPKGAYAEFIERWSNPRFEEYVRALRRLAEEHHDAAGQQLFNEVLVHEREFWRMSREE